MKRTIACVIAAIAVVFSIASAAPASAMHYHAGPDKRSCTNHCVNWQLHKHVPCGTSCAYDESEAQWTTRNSPTWYIRGHERCVNRSNNTAEDESGGWVTPLHKFSAAKCFEPYVVIHAGWQYKECSSCSIHTVWVYPSARRLARFRVILRR